mmetsp:Transcript_28564/g.60577  ORF Transcript_28564/g.60577 Transcript_28564/m.60577 type:complete len:249 (-) Transcript_28564:52-798(-)
MTSSTLPPQLITSRRNIASSNEISSISLIPMMRRSTSLFWMVKDPSLSMSRTRPITSSRHFIFKTSLNPLLISLFSLMRSMSSSSCDPCVSDNSLNAASTSFIRSTSLCRSSISADSMSFWFDSLPCSSLIPFRAVRNVSSFVSCRSLYITTGECAAPRPLELKTIPFPTCAVVDAGHPPRVVMKTLAPWRQTLPIAPRRRAISLMPAGRSSCLSGPSSPPPWESPFVCWVSSLSIAFFNALCLCKMV